MYLFNLSQIKDPINRTNFMVVNGGLFANGGDIKGLYQFKAFYYGNSLLLLLVLNQTTPAPVPVPGGMYLLQ